jgi:dihydroxyacid dehydratase/phosphogluconate dehydratase
MEAGQRRQSAQTAQPGSSAQRFDLVDAMVKAVDSTTVSDEDIAEAIRALAPVRPAARVQGMFTANSMNCLT